LYKSKFLAYFVNNLLLLTMKKIVFVFFLIVSFSSLYAQIDFYEHPDNKPDTSILYRKFLYGGDFSFGIGYSTRIYLSPKIAYPVTNFFTVGVGADGMFYSEGGFKTFLYGANAFSEIYIMKFLTVHFEYAKYNVEDLTNYPYSTRRIWIEAYYLGGGYRQMISERAYMCYLLLWDFNYSEYSYFSNPVFRLTFYF